MAQDVTNSISFYLTINEVDEAHLAVIRKWKNLKVSTEEGVIWVTNFEEVQIDSVEVKSIPNKHIFYSKKGKLYPQHSLLPSRNEPSFLWTPIERAFPLELKNYNHNYFGIDQKFEVIIAPSANGTEAEAMLISLSIFYKFIQQVSATRLRNLSWVILNSTEAFIFGKPLLPLNGEVFWKKGNHFLPIGYDFDLAELSSLIDMRINYDQNQWNVWQSDSTYFGLDKSLVQPLTIGGVRASVDLLPRQKIQTENE